MNRMKKKVTCIIAIVVAFACVFTIAEKVADKASADGIQKVISAKDFGDAVSWGATGEKTDDGLKVNFTGQYTQIILPIQERIDLADCESVTFAIADQNVPISLKLWDMSKKSDSADYTEVYVEYGKNGNNEYTIMPTSDDEIDAIGLMITDDASDVYATISSVTFNMTKDKADKSIEKDIPNWKDAITKRLGDDTHAGLAIMNSEVTDDSLMDLVEKHANAVTLGNELKPDCIFGYNNAKCPGTKKDTLNGEEMEVPIMDFTLANKCLDKIVDWNDANPSNKIMVRGHVLVWHSQTPEWFFHEGYDADNEYVSKEVMNKRLEWYIKSLYGYYFADDSKYKDLFYGWDVVNEAISDNTGSYRTDVEPGTDKLSDSTHGSKSSWWHVYQSEEFIVNAFKFANKYAPKNLELYYNDYNETSAKKMEGILKLLNTVKNAEGTRISAMGMQAHYDMLNPSINQIDTAAREYAKVVGKVQMTELDLKSSGTYDGTSATRGTAYTKQAYRYKEIFDCLANLEKDGIDVNGVTIWGVIDKNSWLHQQAGVGGGSDGKDKQCPLLFDDYYKAKPAFYGFVDPDKLEPAVKNITVVESNDDFSVGNECSMVSDSIEVKFVPIWNDNGMSVKVTVDDATNDANDGVIAYVDLDNSRKEDASIKKYAVKRSEAKATSNGYEAIINISTNELKVSKKIGFDLVVVDGDTKIVYNDLKKTQDSSSKYYADATIKPYTVISNGTANIDGNVNEWDNIKNVPLKINKGAKVESAVAKLMWDNDNLYVYMNVKDPVLNKDSVDEYQQDSFEIFIDENNHKTESYEEDDKQYRINYENLQSFNGTKCNADNVKSVAKVTDDGYMIEAAYKWTDVEPKEGMQIGLELQINDADESGSRIGTLSWYDESGNGWSSTGVYGTATLAGKGNDNDPTQTGVPTETTPTVEPQNPTDEPTIAPTEKTTDEPKVAVDDNNNDVDKNNNNANSTNASNKADSSKVDKSPETADTMSTGVMVAVIVCGLSLVAMAGMLVLRRRKF